MYHKQNFLTSTKYLL